MLGTLLIGGIAGWLTGQFTKGEGYGMLMNIGLGILGGWFGGWVFGLLNIGTGDGFISRLLIATVGAFLLVWIYKKVVKKS